MLTDEQKELFQKDKYELVDIIISLRKGKKEPVIKESFNKENVKEGAIERALNKLNKEMSYGNKKENKCKTNRKEEKC